MERIALNGNITRMRISKSIEDIKKPIDIVIETYKTLLEPVLTGGGELYFYKNYDKIDRVYYQHFKKNLGIPNHINNTIIEMELGIWPPSTKAKYLAINYYIKLMKNTSNNLIQKIIKLLRVNETLHPKNNWINEIEKLIENIGGIQEDINEIIQNKDIIDVNKGIKEHIKKAIWKWKYKEYNQLQYQSESIKKYLNITNYTIGPHAYLQYNMEDYIIKATMKFKIGGFELNHKNNKIHGIVKRVCKIHNKELPITDKCSCEHTDIEDELHILTTCTKYNKVRQQLYPSIKYVKNYKEIGIIIDKSTKENLQKLMKLISIIEKKGKKLREINCLCE